MAKEKAKPSKTKTIKVKPVAKRVVKKSETTATAKSKPARVQTAEGWKRSMLKKIKEKK